MNRTEVTQIYPERAIIDDYLRSGGAARDLRTALEMRRCERTGRQSCPDYDLARKEQILKRLRHVDAEKLLDLMLDVIAFSKLRGI